MGYNRPYLQHGSRHAPTGSDPIPNLVRRWAMYSGFLEAAASSAIQYVPMQQLTTNDAELYDYGSGVGGNQIPQVHEAGMYAITYSVHWNSATVGDRLQSFFSGDIGNFADASFGWNVITYATASPAGDNLNNTTNFTTYRMVPAFPSGVATLPASENPTVQNLTAARSFRADVHCFIEKMADGVPALGGGTSGYVTDGIFTW